MNVKISETGEHKSLVIRSENGIEWTNDLVGNAGAFIDGQFTWSEEDDAYIADQATYDWWAKYISEQDATEEDIDLLAGKFDIDKSVIREAVAANTGDDYEQHRREAIAAIDEIRDEYAVTTAAATLGRKGGKSTSAAKSDAARENGRKGGRHLASYYVRIDSYWQNSGDFFVGPFANRDEAQTEIDRAVSDPESLVVPANQMAQDIEHGVRVHSILTKTQAKQAGLHESFGDTYERNVVGVKIPRTAHQMWHANDIF